MWKYIFYGLLSVVLARFKSFENYKVYRVVPATDTYLQVLRELQEAPWKNEYTFLTEPSAVNSSVDILVSPTKNSEFLNIVRHIKHTTLIENVQPLIEAQNPRKRNKGRIDWDQYYSAHDIFNFMEDLAKSYPDNVEVIVGGRTYYQPYSVTSNQFINRTIKGVKVSFKAGNPGIFLEGGIHPTEWISPATVTFILNALLTSTDPKVRALAERHDWYIFPVFNPDAYDYSIMTDWFDEFRFWKSSWDLDRVTKSIGQDLNRNWDYEWNQGRSSNDPHSQIYAGDKAFSAVEAYTLSQFISSISDKFYAYIAFHSYGQKLLIPYSYTTEHLDNYDDEMRIGRAAIDALSQRYGTKYTVENETEYIASGSSVNWVKKQFKTPITFTYELRDTGNYGVLLPRKEIIPTAQETLDSLVAMFEECQLLGYPKKVEL